MSASKLELYSYWKSSCAWRVRFALNLKGIDYQYKAVNLFKGEQFSPEFEQVNPLHFVPTLVDDGFLVSDSLAILLYLEEKFPHTKPLLPVDARLKAINFQATNIVCSSIQPLHMLTILNYIEEKLGSEEKLSWARSNIEKGLKALETLLKKHAGKFSIGDEVHMADVFLAPQIAVAADRFNVDMARFPTLSRIYESCKELPEYQAALPERQPDAVVP